MSVVRAFIAIEIPPAIHTQLDKISKDLQGQTKTRAIHWVPANNIHLTLKFLGEVSSANLEHVTKIMSGEAARYSPFEIQVGGIGAFPSVRRPRVIWVGIESPPLLKSIQKGLEAETLRLGYVAEERDFSPHLTLARISHNVTPEELRTISEVMVRYKVGNLGAFRVESVRLFKSDLLPGGAVYTPLFTSLLKPDDHRAKV
jgi:RNA 2',3'-cyclic 3'-phosphodiesterase